MKSLFKIQSASFLFMLVLLFSANTAWSQKTKPSKLSREVPEEKYSETFEMILQNNISDFVAIESLRFNQLMSSDLTKSEINSGSHAEFQKIFISQGYESLINQFLSSKVFKDFRLDNYRHLEIQFKKNIELETQKQINLNSPK